MKNISIKSSIRNYKVNFTSSIKSNLSNIYNCGDVYLIDKNVYKIHNLKRNIKSKKIIFIDASEKSKSFENLGKIIKKILSTNLKKDNKLIVIGGGITQDIASFISSIIFRGIDWIFIPTSFLSQCDSCIGGKTSINFFGKKNQLGNFYPPSAIYIDTLFLKSLGDKDIRSGVGEMAHYYFVSGNKDFKLFLQHYKKVILKDLNSCKKLIFRSLMIKKYFIEKDEFDKKERLLLNYGHTFGHAIESITDYKIPHGIAVANGMDIANFLSLNINLITQKEFEEMHDVLSNIYKNIQPEKINSKQYIQQLKKDKKNINENLRCILTKGVGKMVIKELSFDSNLIDMLSDYSSRYL